MRIVERQEEDMDSKIKEKVAGCRFGVDYYPEHWPQKRWEIDAQMMQGIGMQVVRMAEFAWHKMEPKEGCFNFGWLDEAIAIMGKYGIYTILGTPTASPPAWVIERNPEILPIDSAGQQKSFGARHHDCMSSPIYRKHVKRIVRAMAEHYKDNPFVIGWQIDNELGNSHEDLCMCESCRAAFQSWLKEKYGSIGSLNEAWGTVFWSQTYDSFSQIPALRQTPTKTHNPSHALDWKRFCSDLVIDFQREQVNLIRQISPGQMITHNLMGLYDKTDYFEFARDLDFASNDQYPTGYYFDAPGQRIPEISACLDLIRGVKHQNFWMMELESGPTGGDLIGPTPRPGQLMLWTAQCIAHGADAIIYFRWRSCLFGTEQFWHGILPHNGIPGRRYREIEDTIKKLAPVLNDVHGISERAQAAMLFSYDQDWALQIQPQHPDLSYVDEIERYYEAFYRHNVKLDFVSEKDGFMEYRLLVAPLQYIAKPDVEERLLAYVASGGALVLTMRTGVKDENNICIDDGMLPGKLAEAAGVIVEEYDCLLWKENALVYGGKTGAARKWCDILKVDTAEVLATFTSEYYAGRPAVTVNSYGKGKVYYVATEPDGETLYNLAGDIIRGIGLDTLGETPEGVELYCRKGKKADYLFVLNYTEYQREVQMPEGWHRGRVVLEPYGVEIFTQEHKR